MSTILSVPKIACPYCKAHNALEIVQFSQNGILRWYESLNCENCNTYIEADGYGIPPEEIRIKLIQLYGSWYIGLNQVISVTNTTKVIHHSLSLKLNEAVKIVKNSPENLYIGTKDEIAWLFDLLMSAGELPITGKISE